MICLGRACSSSSSVRMTKIGEPRRSRACSLQSSRIQQRYAFVRLVGNGLCLHPHGAGTPALVQLPRTAGVRESSSSSSVHPTGSGVLIHGNHALAEPCGISRLILQADRSFPRGYFGADIPEQAFSGGAEAIPCGIVGGRCTPHCEHRGAMWRGLHGVSYASV